MNVHRLAGFGFTCLLTVICASTRATPLAAATPDDAVAAAGDGAPFFRVFLKDGTSLVSYGELARLDDRVVFSMPTSASAAAPQLQLINIAADRVDWDRTGNYAESLRASRYLATRAESDYGLLTNAIAQALNDVGQSDDPSTRLAIVEKARRTLAEWPASHYNYQREQILQTLATLDEAIADMRASTGASSFDLSLVAPSTAPRTTEPLLPTPDSREVIEQTLRAAHLTDSPAERVSLLTTVLNALDHDAAGLPADWVLTVRIDAKGQIAHEADLDRRYRAFTTRTLGLASSYAKLADVRGVQRVLAQVKPGDAALGNARPDIVASLVASIEDELEVARRLRLERDRWALRAPDLRTYRMKVGLSLERLRLMKPQLEDIKSLAGTGPDAINAILRGTEQVMKSLAKIDPPFELRDIHALLVSATQLADNAAKIRREAAINGNMSRAWDASSAAAGALMLADRARNDLQQALRPPQISR